MQYMQKVTLANTNRNDTLVFNNLFFMASYFIHYHISKQTEIHMYMFI